MAARKPQNRARGPVEQRRYFYYLLLSRDSNIGEQVVIGLREPLALERTRIPF